MVQRLTLHAICFIMLMAPVHADIGSFKTLKNCGSFQTFTVLNGDKLEITGETTIALADVKAPELWPSNTPYKSWPYAQTTKAFLTKRLTGHSITLFCKNKPLNHVQEIIAHVVLDNGEWIQEWMVRNGHAYFSPRYGQSLTGTHLQQAESIARERTKGLWSNPAFKPVSALGTNIKPGWFQLVQGTVISAKQIRETLYLNFGDDWRTDFTIQIPKNVIKAFEKSGSNPLSFKGSEIEVRGWVEWSGGPKIILTHPDQLTLLSIR